MNDLVTRKPGKKPKARPSKVKAPNAAAVRQIVQWVLDGHSEAHILDAIANEFPTDQPAPLIVTAMGQIADAGNPNAEIVRGFAIEATRQIYQKALEVADHQTALRALSQLVKLSG